MNPVKNRSDSKKLIEPLQWCRYIVNAGYAVSGLIVLAHVIWFFAARSILTRPPEIYLRNYILLPAAGLFALCLLVSFLINLDRIPLGMKEFFSLALFILISFYLTMTHGIAKVLLCAFLLPLFASTLFSSVKITRAILWLNGAALFVLGAKWYLSGILDGERIMELFVALFLFICAYLIARLLIRNGQNHYDALAHSDDTQKYMQEQLLLDPFTGLLNRRTFDTDLEKMWREGRGSGMTAAAAMIDIDEFKFVNDRFGHAAGDRVLLNFSRVLKSIRSDNIRVYRIGGDEFAVLFRDSTASGAFDICDQIREQMRNSSLRDSDNHKVTISCGLASMVPDGRAAAALTSAADMALYKAKNEGRNRVVKFDGMEGESSH